ncbi:tetrahydrofolate synthase [Bacteroidia bacterium]|nr:tetrahydrofolate synthase [Bacteroidia bacterium]
MNYEETLEWMFAQLPMYQREGQSAYKANLDNTLKLDAHFSHPHTSFMTVHVAGTNGKGSTSHILASVLQEAGYKTGLYTSPHLKDFRERIKVNGEMISKEYVTAFINENKTFFSELQPSFFEMTVCMAFHYFRAQQVQIAVIEVGLGGRLDSTNIITPLVSIITNISKDHTALLGNTLEAIAAEKAGIIKTGVPVVIGDKDKAYSHVFVQKAKELNAPLTFAQDEWLGINNIFCELKGQYQMKNIPAIMQTIRILQNRFGSISETAIRKGFASVVRNTGLYGRWQVLSEKPYTICDTAHNEDGIREVVKQMTAHPHERLHFVFGMVNDKDISTVLNILPQEAIYYFTKASIPRALNETVLAAQARALGLEGDSYPTVTEAYSAAREAATEDDMIYIGGSTFVVAEVI